MWPSYQSYTCSSRENLFLQISRRDCCYHSVHQAIPTDWLSVKNHFPLAPNMEMSYKQWGHVTEGQIQSLTPFSAIKTKIRRHMSELFEPNPILFHLTRIFFTNAYVWHCYKNASLNDFYCDLRHTNMVPS